MPTEKKERPKFDENFRVRAILNFTVPVPVPGPYGTFFIRRPDLFYANTLGRLYATKIKTDVGPCGHFLLRRRKKSDPDRFSPAAARNLTITVFPPRIPKTTRSVHSFRSLYYTGPIVRREYLCTRVFFQFIFFRSGTYFPSGGGVGVYRTEP